MIHTELNFFSSMLQCITRTKEQKAFEQKLYLNGVKKEQVILIEKINKIIASQDLATKFVLQELDVARNGDAFTQNFAKKSGFHLAQYLGALEKFKEEREEIEEIQVLYLNFLDKIANEKIMFQTSMAILDGVMEHWIIGKYSEEGKFFVQEEERAEAVKEQLPIEKKVTIDSLKIYMNNIKAVVMGKLEYADDRIQDVLDKFNKIKDEKIKARAESKVESKEKLKTETKTEKKVKIYTEEKINDLMEKYSHVIEDIITGDINPKNREEIEIFEEEISLAAEEGNNLASVFCAFYEPKASHPNLPLPIINMNDKSKTFFIQILNTFEEKGFSESLENYLEENRENVYALATGNDKFMQYLMAFWYVWENEDESKIIQEQNLWYAQSAANGFEPAVQKMTKE
ncbi:MAG: Unknown protein [uncultured Sulfurovum sp.]|uniref:Uncharacterized protein n=1 Tax=uncultured Sulfurovum sp. TaxID=269237 RepID=A0A6S6U0G8_9BACT|nr:MAG: Unknown protein [uncultured Sulfurovum sp.]